MGRDIVKLGGGRKKDTLYIRLLDNKFKYFLLIKGALQVHFNIYLVALQEFCIGGEANRGEIGFVGPHFRKRGEGGTQY